MKKIDCFINQYSLNKTLRFKLIPYGSTLDNFKARNILEQDRELAESYSYDNGMTWTEAKLSGIVCADTRFFVSYTPSGRLLLVTNDDGKTRKNLTLKLSEDEGASWKYACCIDTRDSISYPDVDFFEDKIYLTYDRERTGAKEILFTAFVENDIMNSTVPPATIVSKP